MGDQWVGWLERGMDDTVRNSKYYLDFVGWGIWEYRLLEIKYIPGL